MLSPVEAFDLFIESKSSLGAALYSATYQDFPIIDIDKTMSIKIGDFIAIPKIANPSRERYATLVHDNETYFFFRRDVIENEKIIIVVEKSGTLVGYVKVTVDESTETGLPYLIHYCECTPYIKPALDWKDV